MKIKTFKPNYLNRIQNFKSFKNLKVKKKKCCDQFFKSKKSCSINTLEVCFRIIG